MFLSIVMPVYNSAKYLPKCLRSIWMTLRSLVGCLENVILANKKQYAGLYPTLAIVAK